MKKITLLYFLCLWIFGSAYAQKFSLSAGYSLLKMPVSSYTTENTFTSSKYIIANPNTIDTYMVIRTKSKYSSDQNVTYFFNNGLTAKLNLQWKKGKKWSFNSGVGVDYYDFTAIINSSNFREEILSSDTINSKYVFTDTDINSGYTYKYKNFPTAPLKEGVNFKILYLTTPFSLGYEVEKDRFGVEIGGQISTLLRGKSIQEQNLSQYDYDEKAKIIWVTYTAKTDVKTANNNLNTFGFSCFAQLNYTYKKLGVNLGFAQNLTNLFRYDAPLTTNYEYYSFNSSNQYSSKPTSYTIKFVYYLGKNVTDKSPK